MNSTEHLAQWLQENLFTHEFFDNKFFHQQITLVSYAKASSLEKHLSKMESETLPLRREDIYRAVMKASGVHKLNREALWFHVNVHDQCVWTLEAVKQYAYPLLASEPPLATLINRVQKFPADQAGTTYVGLLSERKEWLLLIEKGAGFLGADFKISFCGSPELCKTVGSLLKQRPL